MLQELLVGSSIQRLVYSITQWEITFLGKVEALLVSSEFNIGKSTLDWFTVNERSTRVDTLNAVSVGSVLLSLTNGPRVVGVSVLPKGDVNISFSDGAQVCALGTVPGVDWTWSIHSDLYSFTCDGPWDV